MSHKRSARFFFREKNYYWQASCPSTMLIPIFTASSRPLVWVGMCRCVCVCEVGTATKHVIPGRTWVAEFPLNCRQGWVDVWVCALRQTSANWAHGITTALKNKGSLNQSLNQTVLRQLLEKFSLVPCWNVFIKTLHYLHRRTFEAKVFFYIREGARTN